MNEYALGGTPASTPDITHLGGNVYMVRVEASYEEKKAVEVARLESNLAWKNRVIDSERRLRDMVTREIGKDDERNPRFLQPIHSDSVTIKPTNKGNTKIADVLSVLFLMLCIAYVLAIIVTTFFKKGGE